MNRSYSKIRHIQETNRLLESRISIESNIINPNLIKEQNATYWDAVQGVSDNPQGKKVVVKEFASNNLLTNPEKGTFIFTEDKSPVYVGSYLQAQYQPLVKKVDSPGQNLSSPFGYSLQFFLSNKQGSTGWPNNRPTQAEYFEIKCAKLKNGKFQILTVPNFSSEFKVQSMDVIKGGGRATVELSLTYVLKDLDGWMGSLRSDINGVLEKMGYPLIPNTLKWNGLQDVA